MNKSLRKCGLLAGALSSLAVRAASGASGLAFTDNDLTPTTATVSAGSTFAFSVKLTEAATTDPISGVDYQINASNNGVFEFLSRNSQVAGSSFTVPNGSSDAQLLPVILNPNNGTDLGTSTSSGLAVSNAGSYELADFSFEVLPGTAPGIYTLSFASTAYSGAPPGYAPGNFIAANLGTFTVTVPEPASMALVGGLGLLLCRRRSR